LERSLAYAGIGIAIEIVIESTVNVTIRQSETEPTASVAATAPGNRDNARAERPLKPAAPEVRIMAGHPSMRARITRKPANHC
jgi:hypothetical protein